MSRVLWVIGLSALVGIGTLAALPSAPIMHWCCMQDTSTGFGTCTREELKCLPTGRFYGTTQERAACFDYRAVVRDEGLEDCNPTMTSCEKSRARKLEDREYDGVTECRPVGANQASRLARYRTVAIVTIPAAILLALIALYRWYIGRGTK